MGQKYMIRKMVCLFILDITFLNLACTHRVEKIEVLGLPQKNPISYIYPLKMDKLILHIKSLCNYDTQQKNPIFPKISSSDIESRLGGFSDWGSNTLSAWDVKDNPFGTERFPGVVKSSNANDLFLYNLSGRVLWESPVYGISERKLYFNATFHLHFISRSENETEITVTALEPCVINGEKYTLGHLSPGYIPRFESVQPTTIEEYMILRYIGASLGITNMPALILPEINMKGKGR
jgi:hypothetical protein